MAQLALQHGDRLEVVFFENVGGDFQVAFMDWLASHHGPVSLMEANVSQTHGFIIPTIPFRSI